MRQIVLFILLGICNTCYSQFSQHMFDDIMKGYGNNRKNIDFRMKNNSSTNTSTNNVSPQISLPKYSPQIFYYTCLSAYVNGEWGDWCNPAYYAPYCDGYRWNFYSYGPGDFVGKGTLMDFVIYKKYHQPYNYVLKVKINKLSECVGKWIIGDAVVSYFVNDKYLTMKKALLTEGVPCVYDGMDNRPTKMKQCNARVKIYLYTKRGATYKDGKKKPKNYVEYSYENVIYNLFFDDIGIAVNFSFIDLSWNI